MPPGEGHRIAWVYAIGRSKRSPIKTASHVIILKQLPLVVPISKV